MSAPPALRRLLRIRELEEEQCRGALERAVAERHRLEAGLAGAAQRGRRGRLLIAASVASAEVEDRIAGLEEIQTARRLAAALAPRLAQMDQVVTALRQKYLDARVERRQVETLLEEAQTREAAQTSRRTQQSLDEWYSNRTYRAAEAEKPARGDGQAQRGASPKAGAS